MAPFEFGTAQRFGKRIQAELLTDEFNNYSQYDPPTEGFTLFDESPFEPALTTLPFGIPRDLAFCC